MIISILLLIFVLFSMAGLIQANISSPPIVPPSTPEPDESESQALFNDQIYLMDRYASGEAQFTSGRRVSCTQVPATFPAPVLNTFLQASRTNITSWLTQITSEEYAQLVPAVKLSIVDIETATEYVIPLGANSNIEAGLRETEYWYTNKTVGLKSFDMKLDGNTNPVGGKIYNISLTLAFDSINTFFGAIDGVPLRYSDVFRSQGPAGSALHEKKVKLTVYYDGPPGLVTKYDLRAPGMHFSSYLTLLTSDLELEENLSAKVTTQWQGYEESLFNNGGVFDWLRLDTENLNTQRAAAVAAASAELARDTAQSLQTAQSALATIRGGAGGSIPSPETYDAKVKLTRRHVTMHTLALQAAKSAATVARYPEGPGMSAGDRRALNNARDHLKSQRRVLYGEIRATSRDASTAGLTTLSLPSGVDFSKDFNNLTTPELEALSAYATSNAYMNETMRNAIVEHAARATTVEGGWGIRVADLFSASSLGRLGSRVMRAQQVIHKHKTNVNSLTSAHNDNMLRIALRFGNIRIKFIRDVLEKTIFDHANTVFHEIKITSEEVKRYLSVATVVEARNFNNAPPVSSYNPAGGELGSYESLIKRDVVTAGSANHDARREYLTAELRKASRLLNIQRSSSGAEADAIAAQVAKVEILTQQVNELNSNLKVLGSKTDLEASLNDFEVIEFIYFGDLISLIMQRLKSGRIGAGTANKNTSMQQQSLTRTLIGLTNIQLQNLENLVTHPLYKFPISVRQFQKILADKLYGTQRGTYTLFELLSDLANLIKLTQQRKALLTDKPSNTSYSVKYLPLALLRTGAAYQIASSMANDERRIVHGILVTPDDTEQTMPGGGAIGSSLTSRGAKIPHFHLGGAAKSVLKSVKMSQISDSEMMKVQFKRNHGGDSGGIIPVLYKVELVLMGTPFFHLGTYFYLDTATLNLNNSNHWFHLRGYYQVYQLNHSLTAGGGYETHVTGLRQHLTSRGRGTPVPASSCGGILPGP